MSQNILDHPEILRVVFHPRSERGYPRAINPVSVPVEPGVNIGGRLYPACRESPAILYFHGNGEIAADYDDLAPLYNQMDITLLVMDYRGYGTSDGSPTATNLLADARMIYNQVNHVFAENDMQPARLYVMGRSLGSAAAIEIAHQTGEKLAGLIVESGFANTFDLLATLGVRVQVAGAEQDQFSNLTKIERVTTRTLIIHGEADFLIPLSEGRALYEHSAARDKRLVLIPNAGHNDLMMVGMTEYFGAIREFVVAL
ncbi:hypothetical protein ANRL3_01414 [Anaerolineae bacterium]|nr:hypothetical protein ANRL3_01414 [Anaerolineae bacterium]